MMCTSSIVLEHYYRACALMMRAKILNVLTCTNDMLLPEVESRTQGSRPRPRTQKNPRPRPRPRTAFPRTDTLEAKDRNARGQGPRTQARVLSKKKKNGLHKNFLSDLHKKTFSQKFFKRSQNFNNSKNSAVLEPRTGQFSRIWGLEAKAKDLAFEAKDFIMCPRGRSSRPRTSLRTPPLAVTLTKCTLVH